MAKLEVLYHYTTNAGLIGIVTNRKLWATSIRHMNDSTEYHYAFGVLDSALSEHSRGCKGAHLNRIQQLRREFDPQDLEMVSSVTASLGATFVTSFTENGDQLSQWRAYGQGGGYSIGFRLDALLELADGVGGTFAACSYDRVNHKNVASGIAQNVVENLRTSDSQADWARVRMEMNREILEHAFFWKHPSFKEEGEWRLVFNRSPGETLFRTGRSAIVPYAEINLDNNPSDPNIRSDVFKDIVIGPCAEPNLAFGSAMLLFHANKVACSGYKFSQIPYRNW